MGLFAPGAYAQQVSLLREGPVKTEYTQQIFLGSEGWDEIDDMLPESNEQTRALVEALDFTSRLYVLLITVAWEEEIVPGINIPMDTIRELYGRRRLREDLAPIVRETLEKMATESYYGPSKSARNCTSGLKPTKCKKKQTKKASHTPTPQF